VGNGIEFTGMPAETKKCMQVYLDAIDPEDGCSKDGLEYPTGGEVVLGSVMKAHSWRSPKPNATETLPYSRPLTCLRTDDSLSIRRADGFPNEQRRRPQRCPLAQAVIISSLLLNPLVESSIQLSDC
jgi:hypothetical protein